MLSALAHDAEGDRGQAFDALQQSWAGAPEPAAYVRLFLDEGAPMRQLLTAAHAQGIAVDHVRRLVAVGIPTDSRAARTPLGAPSAEQLSERELQVLRLLDSELTGPQIARELFITLNTLRSHTKRIFTKLDVTTRRAAVSSARERGLM